MSTQLDPVVANDLAGLFLKLSHDPKTRKIIAKAVKDGAADTPHAKAFADVELEDRFDTFTRTQEEKEIKRAQEEVLSRMNQKRAALLTGGSDGQGRKYAEEDIKKIEALMERKGITDYEDGATLYAATLPPVDPRPQDMPVEHGATWEFPQWNEFSENPDKAARNTAHSVITEFMRKR